MRTEQDLLRQKTWDLTSAQAKAAKRTIFSFDEYDTIVVRCIVNQVPHDTHAIKTNEAYVFETGIHKTLRIRLGAVYMDIQTTQSPYQMERLMKLMLSDTWRARYISVHAAAGRTAVESAARTINDMNGHEDDISKHTRLVLASVPSTMSEEECKETFNRSISETIKAHHDIARECGITAISASPLEFSYLPDDTLKIATGLRHKGDEARGHVRVVTPAQAIEMGADLVVAGSIVMASELEPQQAYYRVLDEVASVI